MKKVFYLFACCLFIVGCASKPVPEWTTASYNQLESYKKNFLQGRERLAEINFRKTIEEMKSGGDLMSLQTAYLTQYALQTAVLGSFDDREYLRLSAVETNRANVHFHSLLKGAFDRVDEDSLPPQYRSFLRACRSGKQAEIAQAIAGIEDPFSRIIASGLAVQTRRYDEAILNMAVRTASEQGWKRALLIYLEKLHDDYKGKNELDKAEATRQRINLLQ
jgi:hypothetical protein